jgi:predicted SAM-dependent methyltransferase
VVKGLKLDLGAGQNVTPGYEGVDIVPGEGIKHVVDLLKFPWPFKTGSVAEVVSSHFVEHIPHRRPEWKGTDGWFLFMDELHRVLKKNGTARFVHPYSASDRADWDPTHERRIHEMTWYYLDADWRKANGLDHYPVKCDFEVVVINGLGIPDNIASRNDEAQAFARSFYRNVIADLDVTIKKRG